MSILTVRPSRRIFTVVAVLAGLLAISAPGPAKKKNDPQPVFEDTAQVVEVEVPVNVTGADGQPVRGLTADSFQVLDEGTPQEILDLRVVDLEVWQPGTSSSPIAVAAEMPAVARRHFLFLFDLSFTEPAATLKAQRAASDFVLTSLHPTDLAAVATYSLENGPQLVITFTPDRAQLAHAINTLGLKRRATPKEDPLRFVLAPFWELQDYASLTDTDMGQTRAEQIQDETTRILTKHAQKGERIADAALVTAFSRSMADMAKALDSVRGRKQIVLFSEGFDSRLFLGRRPDLQDDDQVLSNLEAASGEIWMIDSNEKFGSTGLQNDLEQMLETFRRADCTIQAVDVRGLRADFGAQDRRSSGQEALFYMANGTGGELFEDSNRFGDQLERVLTRTSVTYLLTFRPSDVAFDGAYHRLKIKAETPRGARLSHRKGYFAPRPYAELHPLERSLLAADAIASAEPRSEIDLALLVAPFRAGDQEAYVPVIVEIDGADLLAGNAGDRLSAEVYAYVTNDRGEMRDFFTQQIGLDTGAGGELLSRGGLKYYGHFSLPSGTYQVRVLVRNATTGRAGVRAAHFEVPDYAVAAPDLLPPFFFEQAGKWVLVKEQNDTGGGSVVYPFTVNGQPFIPAAWPRLSARREANLCLMAYNLGDGQLTLEDRVVAADGSPVATGRLSLTERTITGIQGVDKLLARFDPTGLSAGDYTLEVAIRPSGDAPAILRSIPISVLD